MWGSRGCLESTVAPRERPRHGLLRPGHRRHPGAGLEQLFWNGLGCPFQKSRERARCVSRRKRAGSGVRSRWTSARGTSPSRTPSMITRWYSNPLMNIVRHRQTQQPGGRRVSRGPPRMDPGMCVPRPTGLLMLTDDGIRPVGRSPCNPRLRARDGRAVWCAGCPGCRATRTRVLRGGTAHGPSRVRRSPRRGR